MGKRLHQTDTLPHLRKGEDIGRGLRRVLLACLETAATAMPGDVHKTRLALKRTRALLRLLHDTGAIRTTALRRKLSALGRRLAAARDGEVLARLADRAAVQLSAENRQAARSFARALRHQIRSVNATDWADELRTRRAACGRLSITAMTPDDLLEALARSAHRLRRRCKHLRRADALHALRKSAITLRQQMLVTAPSLDRKTSSLTAELERLIRHLGRFLDWRSFRQHCPRKLQGLRRIAREKQTTARRKALHLARRVSTDLHAFEPPAS